MSSVAITNHLNEAGAQPVIELSDYRGAVQTESLISRILNCWNAGEDVRISFANIERLDFALLQVLVATKQLYDRSANDYWSEHVGDVVRSQLKMIGAEVLLQEVQATSFETAV